MYWLFDYYSNLFKRDRIESYFLELNRENVRIRWRKDRSISEYLIKNENFSFLSFFSFARKIEKGRRMEISMRRAISVSAIIVRRVSFICHLFGDQFSVYIIIAKKRKRTTLRITKTRCDNIFEMPNRKKNRADFV